jgi:hypothetical protein
MNSYKWLPSEPTEEMLKTVDSFMYPVAKVLYERMWQAMSNVEQNPTITLELHNSLVSKLASEMYVVIGSLYASDEKVADSAYELVLDKLMDIINNPNILQTDKDLLIPI